MEEGILYPINYLHFIHNDAKAMIEGHFGKEHKMSPLWMWLFFGLLGLAYWEGPEAYISFEIYKNIYLLQLKLKRC